MTIRFVSFLPVAPVHEPDLTLYEKLLMLPRTEWTLSMMVLIYGFEVSCRVELRGALRQVWRTALFSVKLMRYYITNFLLHWTTLLFSSSAAFSVRVLRNVWKRYHDLLSHVNNRRLDPRIEWWDGCFCVNQQGAAWGGYLWFYYILRWGCPKGGFTLDIIIM